MSDALREVIEDIAEGAMGTMWLMAKGPVMRWLDHNPEAVEWACERLRVAVQEGRL